MSTTPCTSDSINMINLVKALELYLNDSSEISKKCLLISGFATDEIEESSQLYTFFLGKALEYDFQRLEILKSCRSKTEKSDLLNKISRTTSVVIGNTRLEMIRKALIQYRFESSYIMTKYLIKNDFNSSDTDLYHPTYQFFLENILNVEYHRWRYLRCNFRCARKLKSATTETEEVKKK